MAELPDPIETTELPVADPAAELPAPDVPPERISLAVRLAVLAAILLPLLAVVAAPFLVWGWGFRWTDLGLLLGLYVLTALGITVGYHRLFVHRSFETNILVKLVFAVLGSMAVQGPLLDWVAKHRRHHQHADKAGDPHSPHVHDNGVLGVLRGVWHAHIGWLFDPDPPDLDRYVQDLNRSRALRIASALFPVWIVLGLLIPAVLGGLITRTWAGV
jgi:stearoyl-CoA desaturase (delta-9 desaturase)